MMIAKAVRTPNLTILYQVLIFFQAWCQELHVHLLYYKFFTTPKGDFFFISTS